MKAGLLLIVILFSSWAFAVIPIGTPRPLMNVQGKLNSCAGGEVVLAEIYTTLAGTTPSIDGQYTLGSDCIFSIVMKRKTSGIIGGGSSALLAANTPYYLDLKVNGNSVLSARQEFYPHQVAGGAISAASAGVSGAVSGGSFVLTGTDVDFSDATDANVAGSRFEQVFGGLIDGGGFGEPSPTSQTATLPGSIMSWSYNVGFGSVTTWNLNLLNFLIQGSASRALVVPGPSPVTGSLSFFPKLTFWGYSENVHFEPQDTSYRQNVYFGTEAGSKESTVTVYDTLNVEGNLNVNGQGVCYGSSCDARYLVKTSGAGTQTVNNPVSLNGDLALSGSTSDLNVGGLVNVLGTGGLTVSAGVVNSPNNLLLQVGQTGDVFVKKGTTAADEVCLKNSNNCNTGGGSGPIYVLKTGDTMTGRLTIDPSSDTTALRVESGNVYLVPGSKLFIRQIVPSSGGNIELGESGGSGGVQTYVPANFQKAVYIQDTEPTGGLKTDYVSSFTGSSPVTVNDNLVVSNPNTLTVGTGSSGAASVGSLAVRGSSATVSGKDVCLEDGTNCNFDANFVYATCAYNRDTRVMQCQDGSTINDVRVIYDGFGIAGMPAPFDQTIKECRYQIGGGTTLTLPEKCPANYDLVGCSLHPRDFYTNDAASITYQMLKMLCVKAG